MVFIADLPDRQPDNPLLIYWGMQLELSDAEREALARSLRSAIDADRYPLSPRLAPLKSILAKLDPKRQSQPVPLPKAETPSRVMARKRHEIGASIRSLVGQVYVCVLTGNSGSPSRRPIE